MIKILFTAFTTWMSHQVSNSSDDLLIELQKLNLKKCELFFLRQLPVNTQIAGQLVIAKIEEVKPDVIICCGMAESRKTLTLEVQAVEGENVLKTTMNLDKILPDLKFTHLSYDAGQFVCEGLYYHILNYIKNHNLTIHCVFLHVPIITILNKELILTDVEKIITKLSLMTNDQ
jgi:pyroglutamyl-peptidase